METARPRTAKAPQAVHLSPTVTNWPQTTPLPATGFLRGFQIYGNPKATPPIPAILPISRSNFLDGIKSGRYKLTPCKLSERCTAYRVEEVRALLVQLSGGEV